MGYRIDFGIEQGAGGRTLQARIQGRSSRHAERIGRDIAEQAKRESARQLLIDVRGLADRLGALGTLVLAACHHRRVAVIDSDDNELYLLEANPNPQIARDEDFADSAQAAGISYESLLQRILNLGLRWQPESVA